jgi:hypothetical protein
MIEDGTCHEADPGQHGAKPGQPRSVPEPEEYIIYNISEELLNTKSILLYDANVGI